MEANRVGEYIGEVVQSNEIGLVGQNYRIWFPCEYCGVPRWTKFELNKVRNKRCRKCRMFGVKFSKLTDEERKVRGRISRSEEWFRVKDEVLRHYSNGEPKCTKCGFTDIDVLCIDHIDNNGKEHREKIGSHIYRWLRQQGYPKGFQVLCANCNMKKEMLRKQTWRQ